jgi:hypothetical protein
VTCSVAECPGGTKRHGRLWTVAISVPNGAKDYFRNRDFLSEISCALAARKLDGTGAAFYPLKQVERESQHHSARRTFAGLDRQDADNRSSCVLAASKVVSTPTASKIQSGTGKNSCSTHSVASPARRAALGLMLLVKPGLGNNVTIIWSSRGWRPEDLRHQSSIESHKRPSSQPPLYRSKPYQRPSTARAHFLPIIHLDEPSTASICSAVEN